MSKYSNEKEPGHWAFFSDTTEDYVTPRVPELNQMVSIRLRVRKGMASTCFLVLDRIREGGARERRYLRMQARAGDESFDYYEVRFELTFSPLRYFFEIIAGAQRVRFSRRGVRNTIRGADYWYIVPGFRTPSWAEGAVMYQIFVDRFRNGDPTNDVLTGEYCYLGKPVIRVADWDRLPSEEGYREFYGGDLQGVIDKLDYLKELGVEAIYLNPIFLSPSSHKYDTQDYGHIDPHLGRIVKSRGGLLYPEFGEEIPAVPGRRDAGRADDAKERRKIEMPKLRPPKRRLSPLEAGPRPNRRASLYLERIMDPVNLEAGDRLFAELVSKAHRRGIRVILDGVFNHCGSFHRWLDAERLYGSRPGGKKGAYASARSPYVPYFLFKKNRWPLNDSYEAWWDHSTLPKLNYENSPELCEEIFEAARRWVSPPYNADGWRLDVGADLGHSREFNHWFWKRFREEVRKANPDAIILAENYEDSRQWLQGDEWDTIMNYEFFMEPVTGFFTGMEKHSDGRLDDLYGNPDLFWRAALYMKVEDLPDAAIRISMNELSNHDHSRFLTRTNRVVGRMNKLGQKAASEGVSMAVMRQAVLLQMTWTGAPTIYYGDEAGVAGFTDPDNRRTYPWGHEDRDLIRYHRILTHIRKKSRALRRGSILRLPDEDGILAYARFAGVPEGMADGDGPSSERESWIILININQIPVDYEADVTCAGIPLCAELSLALYTDAGGFEDAQGLSEERSAVPVRGGRIQLRLPPESGFLFRIRR